MFHSAQHANEVKPRDKLESGDKEKIKAAVQKTLDWLELNQLAVQAPLRLIAFREHRLLVLIVSITRRGAVDGLLP